MKVLLVDDHALFRVGVRRLLTDDPAYQIVGEAGTAADGLALVERTAPDVVLMDVALPGIDGIRASREILQRAPRTRVLILSAHDQLSDVVDAFAAGVSGYALKEDIAAALLEAIRVVNEGARYVAPALASRLAAFEQRRRPTDGVLGVLSTREREIFLLAAECMMAREIGVELGIARKTVDTHLNRINKKLSLRNMAELVRLAASVGVLRNSPRRGPAASTKPKLTRTARPNEDASQWRSSRNREYSVASMSVVAPGTVVLVVDDDADVSAPIVDLLILEGYDARAVPSGEAAWMALVQGTEPAAIILDLWLQGMSSGEFIRKLRASRHAGVPVLVLTGASKDAVDLDVEAVSRKPVEATTLVGLVDELVRVGPRRASFVDAPYAATLIRSR